jgi:hypothetical protein
MYVVLFHVDIIRVAPERVHKFHFRNVTLLSIESVHPLTHHINLITSGDGGVVVEEADKDGEQGSFEGVTVGARDR